MAAMKKFVCEMLEIVRPFGLRRLVLTCALLFGQAIAQLLAALSVLPFLNAAADMARFRASAPGAFFTSLINTGSDQTLLIAVGLMSLGLLLAGNAMMVFTTWYTARYAHYAGCRIRLALLGRILSRRYNYFLGVNSSTLTKNLVEDTNIFAHWVLVPALEIFSRLLLTVMLIVLLVWVEPYVALWGLVAIGIFYLALVMPLRKRGSKASGQIKDLIRDLYFQVTETTSGIKPIIAGNAQRYFRNRVAAASVELAQVMPRTLTYPAIPRAGFEVLVLGGLIAWVLILLASGGDIVSIMPRVGLIALVAYRLVPSLQMIFAHSVQIATMRQSMDEVLQLIREQQAHSTSASIDEAPAAKPLEWRDEIRFDGVGFTHRGAEKPSLKPISFVIHKGEKVAFVGATGSGKSTLVDVLMGLLEPSQGEVLIDGEPIDPARSAAWRATIGYVPQEVFLLNSSIAENIAFGRTRAEIDGDRIRAVAAEARASEFIDARDGFDTQVGERGVRLSGGQRQRLALARALYNGPSLLVLDEATSALDPATERQVIDAVEAAAVGNLTVVMVAHRLSTVDRCDRIFFLENGSLIASGTYQELLAGVPAFRRFVHSAMHEADDAA
jgi:ATP-binding cassette, subfamily B, bacterial PglK